MFQNGCYGNSLHCQLYDDIDVSCCNKHPQVSIAYQGPVWILLVRWILGDSLLSSEGSKPLPSCSSMISKVTMEGKERKQSKGPSALNKLITMSIH